MQPFSMTPTLSMAMVLFAGMPAELGVKEDALQRKKTAI